MSANLIDISGVETAERECSHVTQQRNETFDLVFGGLFALLGRALAGVADGAFGVEVLRNPTEGMRAGRAELLELFLHGDRRRNEVLRFVHADEVAAKRQHKRGLDVAGMDA